MIKDKEKKRYYLIERKDLLDMLKVSARYYALEAGGVDNWAWYGDSLRDGLEQIIADNPDLKHFIQDMENEGAQGYRDDFDYDELAKWELGFYEEAKET